MMRAEWSRPQIQCKLQTIRSEKMFSHLICRYLLVVLPIVRAVQIPVGSNLLPQHYPNFHQEFFDNINHLTQINRHNVEYIKPSIELGSFTIQTVIPANGPNYNQQQNKPEQAKNFVNAYLPPTSQFNEAPLEASENNGYLPPYTNAPHDSQNSSFHVQAFEIPRPKFLQNLMRVITETKIHSNHKQNLPVNNAFQQFNSPNQVQERRPHPTYGPAPVQNLPVNNDFQQFNSQNQVQERRPHQTYGPAPLINSNQIQANFVPERTHFQDNTLNERRLYQTFGPQAIQNHNERKPHPTYGPQLSTIERRDESVTQELPEKTAFQQFRQQVDSLNQKLSTQQVIDPLNFKRGQVANPKEAQKTEPERKPHQTYGPIQSLENDKNKFMSQTGLLQTNFLPKTDDEIEQNLDNDNSIHAEKFPPIEDSHKNSNSKSMESTKTAVSDANQENLHNSDGFDTKYSADGGYIY